MIDSQTASQIIQSNVITLPTQLMTTRNTLNHILAQPIHTSIPFPPFDRSAMDGYVVSQGDDTGDDFPSYEIIGEIKAGDCIAKEIPAGKTYRIMTGAMVPPNAAKVIMKENVSDNGDHITVDKQDTAAHIRFQGEDLPKDSVLYTAGQRVTPAILANITAAGLNEVEVYHQPRVGILITGSELLECGTPYESGKIYNSNGPLLQALLARDGIHTVEEIHGVDSFYDLKDAFEKLLNCSDVVFVSGGISVGDYDFVEQILVETHCQVHFNKVATKPGKPFTFATHDTTPIFALPGNPGAVFLDYLLFARPALFQMQGLTVSLRQQVYKLSTPYQRRHAKREEYVPIRFIHNKEIEIVPYHGSGDLYGLSQADGLMVVPVGVTEIKEREPVVVVSF